MDITELFYRFGVALGLGILVGLERQSTVEDEETPHFGGVRTFPIISLLGCAAAMVTSAYATWVSDLGGRPAFVTAPDEPDHLFCYWYLQRFTGSWPFAATVPASSLDARFRTVGLCTLSGCRDETLALVAS